MDVSKKLENQNRQLSRLETTTLKHSVQRSSEVPGGGWGRGCLLEGHDTFRGSIPSFFMREIRVVRLISIRAAAPSVPATRPSVILSTRTISSRSLASRVPATGVV